MSDLEVRNLERELADHPGDHDTALRLATARRRIGLVKEAALCEGLSGDRVESAILAHEAFRLRMRLMPLGRSGKRGLKFCFRTISEPGHACNPYDFRRPRCGAEYPNLRRSGVLLDHPELWSASHRKRDAAVIVAHNYDRPRDGWADELNDLGLEGEVEPRERSWWNPGATWLVLIRRRPGDA